VYALTITAFASGSMQAPQQMKDVLIFFVSLLKIAGGVVALIGAVMFFLGLKSDDAHQKQQGIMTALAGAGVFAVSTVASSGSLFGSI